MSNKSDLMMPRQPQFQTQLYQQKHDFNDKNIAARKIFVGGLTWDTTKEHLIEYFSKYGKIEDVNIKIDLNTGRSRGFGFILFDSKEVADKILSIREHIINGKPIDPKPAKHKAAQLQQQSTSDNGANGSIQGTSSNSVFRKIFVGGLDPSVPESEIREYFSKYGRIEEIELPFDKQKNQRRSFCFILFETEEIVLEVLKKQKHTLGGREVDVKKALPPQQNQQNLMLQAQYAAQYGMMDPNAALYASQGFYQQDAYAAQQYAASDPATTAAMYDPYSYQNYEERAYYSPNDGYDQRAMAGGAYYDEQYPPASAAYDPFASSGSNGTSNPAGFYTPSSSSQQSSAPTHSSGHGKSSSKRYQGQSSSYHPYHR